jgi:hypothetical protein
VDGHLAGGLGLEEGDLAQHLRLDVCKRKERKEFFRTK